MNRDTSADGSSPMATLDAIHAQQRSNLERRRPLLARYEEIRRSMSKARKPETVERLREEFDRLSVELAVQEAEFRELVAADIAEVRRLTALLQAAVEEARAPLPTSGIAKFADGLPLTERDAADSLAIKRRHQQPDGVVPTLSDAIRLNKERHAFLVNRQSAAAGLPAQSIEAAGVAETAPSPAVASPSTIPMALSAAHSHAQARQAWIASQRRSAQGGFHKDCDHSDQGAE